MKSQLLVERQPSSLCIFTWQKGKKAFWDFLHNTNPIYIWASHSYPVYFQMVQPSVSTKIGLDFWHMNWRMQNIELSSQNLLKTILRCIKISTQHSQYSQALCISYDNLPNSFSFKKKIMRSFIISRQFLYILFLNFIYRKDLHFHDAKKDFTIWDFRLHWRV